MAHILQSFSFFPTIVFDIVVVDFDFSLPVGDTSFSQMIVEPTINLLGSDRIFK